MTLYVQLMALKKCVAISTWKIAKKLNYHYSTVSRVMKLKREIGDFERMSGLFQKELERATAIPEDR